MRIPLRINIPSNSRPMQASNLADAGIVKNTSSGLNIPDNTVISANGYYQTSDWVLAVGYDVASLVLWSSANVNVEVMAIPVSAIDPSQQLDGISWGSIGGGGYVRAASPSMPGVFGFYLRFIPQGGLSATLIKVLELQLAKL